MNIVLLDPRQTQAETWTISSKRQVEHLHTHLAAKVGDTLKVGVRGASRYLTEIVDISEHTILLRPIQEEPVPAKIARNFNCGITTPQSVTPLNYGCGDTGGRKINFDS